MNKQANSTAPAAPATPRGACPEAIGEVLEARLFKALCDPTRLTILADLAQATGPRSVGEIAAGLPLDVSVVSRHLALLRQAGVLAAERRGKAVYYGVRYEGLADTFRAIAGALEACCPPDRTIHGQTEN